MPHRDELHIKDVRAGRRWTIGAFSLLTFVGIIVAGVWLQRYSLNQRLLEAASQTSDVAVRTLLDAGADPNYRSNSQVPSMPLAAAAWSGNELTVTMLLERGAKVDQTDLFGQTPLMLAAQKGDTRIARILLKAGANVNGKDTSGVGIMERVNRYAGPEDPQLRALLEQSSAAESRSQ